jgi:hypothetical protein
MHCWENISKLFFQLFFILKLSLSDPLLDFYSKKKIVHFIFFLNIKKRFFLKN